MITIQDVTYILHADKSVLFSDINLNINKQDKIALIGNNGSGKSTFLKLLAGHLQTSRGYIKMSSHPYYVPQLFEQYDNCSVSESLQIIDKLSALNEILEGNVTDENLVLLNEDWTIEERCKEAFDHLGIREIDLMREMRTLSGGEKVKVFLAGLLINRPEIVLLDEPSNHLDNISRSFLYNYIRTTSSTLIVVSHDRVLLNLLDTVFELSKYGMTRYGGNYTFYTQQKAIEKDALSHDIKNKEKALRKAKEMERQSLERKQKLDARGKKKQEKAGLPTISMNTFKNNAEKSMSRIKDVHDEKLDAISTELSELRKELPGTEKMKMDFDSSSLHSGKVLITARDINYAYNNQLLWKHPLSFQIISGERIVIAGINGSGKTTLIKMILGELRPKSGTIEKADMKVVYIDQDYSLIDSTLNIYEKAQFYNSRALHEHEIKICLTRFLFTKEDWSRPCKALSGGEKMRLMLCCLMISNKAPDMIVLDEPTNNLDMQNVEILTAAIKEYRGTLLVVSHDEYFLKQIGGSRSIVTG